MAITQPSYPAETNEVVTHVGAYTDTELSTHSSDTTSVHGIADTSALATSTDVSTAVSNHSSDTTSVHGIADTSDLIVEGDSRLTDDRTPSDASVTLAKLHADLKAQLPGVNVFSTTWPTRPTGWAYVIWMGGDASDDDPSADMEVNDLWFPDQE
jgi:hypothetical protein